MIVDQMKDVFGVPNGKREINDPGFEIMLKYLSNDIKLKRSALDCRLKYCKNTINLHKIKLLFS